MTLRCYTYPLVLTHGATCQTHPSSARKDDGLIQVGSLNFVAHGLLSGGSLHTRRRSRADFQHVPVLIWPTGLVSVHTVS